MPPRILEVTTGAVGLRRAKASWGSPFCHRPDSVGQKESRYPVHTSTGHRTAHPDLERAEERYSKSPPKVKRKMMGPKSTMKTVGKMQAMSGKSILTGASLASFSARWVRSMRS